MRGGRRKDIVISIRIPEWLKEEMESININWSEYIRSAIEERVNREKMRSIWREIEDLKNQFER